MKSIFITIPAYNDPVLTRTIDRAIENALYPERLFFCIAMQYDADKLPDISKYQNNPNFSFIFYDVDKRPGIYWIRREMAEKYTGQDYFLMIDSHMSFSKYWDAVLINDYNALQKEKGHRVIMSRPTVPNTGSMINDPMINDVSRWLVKWSDDRENIFRNIFSYSVSDKWNGDRYRNTLVTCNHFFFTNSDYLTDVGFFNTIRAYTEELTMSVASFLSGWDCYFMPEYMHIGHDDEDTIKYIYKRDRFTVNDGKPYQAVYETDLEKMEIAKFLFLDNSSMFKVRNQRRSIEDFYNLAEEDLRQARQEYISMLGLQQ